MLSAVEGRKRYLSRVTPYETWLGYRIEIYLAGCCTHARHAYLTSSLKYSLYISLDLLQKSSLPHTCPGGRCQGRSQRKRVFRAFSTCTERRYGVKGLPRHLRS